MKQIVQLVFMVVLCVGFASCMTEEPDGTVEKTDIIIGTGAEAVYGKSITVHYVGTFTDGRKFDSSRDRFTPFSLVLGARQVIQGWEDGIPGMKVGGRRKLVIPPSLAYGSTARSGIPANSTLVFDIELLSVK